MVMKINNPNRNLESFSVDTMIYITDLPRINCKKCSEKSWLI